MRKAVRLVKLAAIVMSVVFFAFGLRCHTKL